MWYYIYKYIFINNYNYIEIYLIILQISLNYNICMNTLNKSDNVNYLNIFFNKLDNLLISKFDFKKNIFNEDVFNNLLIDIWDIIIILYNYIIDLFENNIYYNYNFYTMLYFF